MIWRLLAAWWFGVAIFRLAIGDQHSAESALLLGFVLGLMAKVDA